MKIKTTAEKVKNSEAGFTLAGVLVALAFLLILMSAAATQWSFIKKRAKEEELLFRGKQYARALKLYYMKFNTFPNELKELVDERCIRQLYKDPMTPDGEWALIRGVNATTALNDAQSRFENPSAPTTEAQNQPGGNFKLTENMGPIIGVCSKSDEKSIKEFNGQRFYNLWVFIADMSVLRKQETKTEEQAKPQQEQREEQKEETQPEEQENPPE